MAVYATAALLWQSMPQPIACYVSTGQQQQQQQQQQEAAAAGALKPVTDLVDRHGRRIGVAAVPRISKDIVAAAAVVLQSFLQPSKFTRPRGGGGGLGQRQLLL
jgi:hypothetical protein